MTSHNVLKDGGDHGALAARNTHFHRFAIWGAFITAILSAFLGYLCGPYTDDLLLSAWARNNSWADILLLKAAPIPVYLAKWKLAVLLNPEAPYSIAHLWAGAVHGLNCYLIFLILREFFPVTYAAAGAAIAAIYRPGNEVWLWAAAENDGILCSFVLLAFHWWRKAWLEPRYYPFAFFAFTVAMLTKPNAIFLIPCLLTHDLAYCRTGSPSDVWQRRAEWLLSILLLGIAYAVFAFKVRGLWESVYPAKPRIMAGLITVGESTIRSLLLIRPVSVIEHDAVGLGVAGLMLIWLTFASPMVRLGLVWFLAFLAPPLIASGFMGGRYVYTAHLGLLLILLHYARAAKAAYPSLSRWIGIAAIIWGIAHLAANYRDIQYRRSWGTVYRELRETLVRHRAEIIGVPKIQLVNAGQPNESWLQQTLLYDLNQSIPIIWLEGDCTEPGLPCVIFRRNLYVGTGATAGAYPSGMESGFVIFRGSH